MTEAEFKVELENLKTKLEASQAGRDADAAAAEAARQTARLKAEEQLARAVEAAVSKTKNECATELKETLAEQAAAHAQELAAVREQLGQANSEAHKQKGFAERRRQSLYTIRKHLSDADAALTAAVQE